MSRNLRIAQVADAFLYNPSTDAIQQLMEGFTNIRRGTGAPTVSALDGDAYVDTSANSLYVRISGAWVLISAGDGPPTMGGDGFALVNSLSTTATLGTHQRTNDDFRGYARGSNAFVQVDGQTSTEILGDYNSDTVIGDQLPEWEQIPTYFSIGVFNG